MSPRARSGSSLKRISRTARSACPSAWVSFLESSPRSANWVSERRETYRATFSVDADSGELTTELDEAMWQTLKVGRRYRLTVGAFSDEVKQVTLAGTTYSYRGK